MANRENNMQHGDDMSPIEQSLVALMRAVLTAEEQQLLAMFTFIVKPHVRQALIAVATAAASTEPDYPATEEGSLMPPPTNNEISLRRVRRALRLRVGNHGDYT